MKNIDNLEEAERNQILQEIDARYQKEVLTPMTSDFVDFFTKIQNFEDGYRTDIPSKNIEVITIFYYAPSTLYFIFAMSDLEFYKENEDVSRPELEMDFYEDYDVHEMFANILEKHNINIEKLEEDYYTIYDFWEHRFSLDHAFLLNCWQEAKRNTNSKLYAFLKASDFAGGITNLDNGDFFFDFDTTVEKYLTAKGIHIQKDEGL